MITFALVHGAWHGAWCWERLAPFLQEAGHDVVAMDCQSMTARRAATLLPMWSARPSMAVTTTL
jgi:hypothetical protein